jgi:hypothetical protein
MINSNTIEVLRGFEYCNIFVDSKGKRYDSLSEHGEIYTIEDAAMQIVEWEKHGRWLHTLSNNPDPNLQKKIQRVVDIINDDNAREAAEDERYGTMEEQASRDLRSNLV